MSEEVVQPDVEERGTAPGEAVRASRLRASSRHRGEYVRALEALGYLVVAPENVKDWTRASKVSDTKPELAKRTVKKV